MTGAIRKSVTQSGTNRKKVGEQQTPHYLLFGCKCLCSTDVKKWLLSLTSEALLTLKERERGGEGVENRHTVESSCFCVYEQRSLVFEGNPEQCSNAGVCVEGWLIGRLGEQLDRGSGEQRDRWTDRVDNAVSSSEWEGWLWGPWAWSIHTHAYTRQSAIVCIYTS